MNNPVARFLFFLCQTAPLILILSMGSAADDKTYNASPPFKPDLLKSVKMRAAPAGKERILYNPKNPYNIVINYELGMHCAGFDVSYCCIIPPYNSIQAQVVQAGLNGERPRLLSPEDKIKLYYYIKDNSYSERNKMKYWQVLKDVNGNGVMGDPGDNMANYVWDQSGLVNID